MEVRLIQSEAATRIASFAIGSARERKKEGILCSFVWVFAWFYISSVVSPARRDIFVTSQGTIHTTLALVVVVVVVAARSGRPRTCERSPPSRCDE